MAEKELLIPGSANAQCPDDIKVKTIQQGNTTQSSIEILCEKYPGPPTENQTSASSWFDEIKSIFPFLKT